MSFEEEPAKEHKHTWIYQTDYYQSENSHIEISYCTGCNKEKHEITYIREDTEINVYDRDENNT